ncbi:hypothetical protein FA15DRAFT_630257 [Coprinopsis marcescibilis]|uniref:Uncharacterized protein n=1 Tax=Coprinopsis marcescibilis TaxID=230819 RepID=A0A5C3LE36_COPMA|nr:hypothetical protein FA15DRAFT_630257 [Coprinopsis marcescibilis]
MSTSTQTVRSHTQQSNRERPRKAAEKKVVFKPVLDNPFRIRWPSVPINLQNAVFAYLLSLLEGCSQYHRNSCKASRKRKRQDDTVASRKAQKFERQGASMDVDQRAGKGDSGNETLNVNQDQPLPPKPPILGHIVLGLNAVTKQLEHQARQIRRTVLVPASGGIALDQQPPLAYVFVCRAEVNPPILIEHIPPLVAACNSSAGKQFVKLIPLPHGAEQKLAESLGIRRSSVIAVDSQYPGLHELTSRLESIPLLTASWLAAPPIGSEKLVPTHVKHIRTSAPKDMKAAKETRLRERHAAKEKKKQKKVQKSS